MKKISFSLIVTIISSFLFHGKLWAGDNMKIGLIGDYDETVPAHQAIPQALKLVSEKLSIY